MPRQAAASAPFASSSGSTRQLIQPPADLDEREKREFMAVVIGAHASHFLPSDIPLIACYAKAIVAERDAARELADDYIVDGKASPWLAIWQAKARTVGVMASKLSLSPASRVPSKSNKEAAPLSYYEQMNILEGYRDDEPGPS